MRAFMPTSCHATNRKRKPPLRDRVRLWQHDETSAPGRRCRRDQGQTQTLDDGKECRQ